MISVSKLVLEPEPDAFDKRCRKKGAAWLDKNPKLTRKQKRPKDYWSPFRITLSVAFSDRCAYGAMYDPNGTVDHFKSVSNDETLAYEWKNYRYCTGWINSSKNSCPEVIDAFEVEDDWFEVILPSLQLVAIDKNIPASCRDRVENALKKLHLQDDERIVRQRREWLRMYEDGEISLDGLRKKAPLIAKAIDKKHAGPVGP